MRDFIPDRLQSLHTYDPKTHMRSYEVRCHLGDELIRFVIYATNSSLAMRRFRNACKQANSLAEFKRLLEI